MERATTVSHYRISADYHGRRAAQEVELAERASDVAVKKAHLELARRHRERCGRVQ
ncbi:MAG: hypothetical protein ACTHKR_05800 [Sphingomonas sp.]